MKVATPLAFDVPLAGEMVELPDPAVSDTVLPETGLPKLSFKVTVTVEVVVPSAVTDVGLAVTVEAVALTEPGVTVNVAKLEATVLVLELTLKLGLT
ncbi:MAG: hypothetical protein NT087_03470 [Deltaproteobacteria bacterium]|nr:hypothetical protein [Deltaproteobacteria bacterium]